MILRAINVFVAILLLAVTEGFFAEYCQAADNRPLTVHFVYGSGTNYRHIERLECSLDSTKMPAGDAEKLSKLVNASCIFESADKDYQVTDGGPFYSVEIKQGDRSRKVSWSYELAPKRVWPLVKYLEKRSAKSVFEQGKKIH